MSEGLRILNVEVQRSECVGVRVKHSEGRISISGSLQLSPTVVYLDDITRDPPIASMGGRTPSKRPTEAILLLHVHLRVKHIRGGGLNCPEVLVQQIVKLWDRDCFGRAGSLSKQRALAPNFPKGEVLDHKPGQP